MKAPINNILLWSSVLSLLSSCEKSREGTPQLSHADNSGFIKYTIYAGRQYCDQNPYRETNYSELKFVTKFDSTAIYQTTLPENQLDVNKLYGFSDNNDDHHHFSARVGWRWSEGALRLFGYTYNNGVMDFEELGTINIGAEYTCSIKASDSSYIFRLNDSIKKMPRASTTATAIGYQLYPYFGGDEPAPHDIHIWIKEL